MKKEKVTLIKPKKSNKNNFEVNIIIPIIFLILGIILLTNSSKAVIIVFYVIGAFLITIGLFNLLNYYNIKNKLKIDDTEKLIIGTSLIFIGILTLLLANTFETFLRFIIGMILIYHGLKNTLTSLNTKNYLFLGIGIVLIIIGLYTILAQNIILQLIGALFIFTSITDFINIFMQKKETLK